MNKKLFFTIFIVMISFLHGTAVRANPLACTAIICLSNIPGAVPSQCSAARQAYFLIQCCYSYFEPATTAQLRDQYLRTCSFVPNMATTMETVLLNIRTKYGSLPTDPNT